MANGELNGIAPWWAKTAWVVGPVTIIAMGLVYLLATGVASDLRLLRENLLLHHNDSTMLNRNIEEHMRVQVLLVRQLCANSAKNADERAGCFKP